MKKSIAIVLTVSALLVAAAGAAGAVSQHATTVKTVTVVMRDPGCHWFAVGASYKTSLTVRGPVSLRNLDMAALKIAGRTGTRLDRVGKRISLLRGTYRITMVGQAPDDNHLRLVVT